MPIEIEKQEKEGQCLLIVKGDVTIYDVQTLRCEMMDGFAAHNGLILDFESVEACDFTGVQLICSAEKTGDALNKGFSVLNASESVLKACVEAGLDLEKFFNKSVS